MTPIEKLTLELNEIEAIRFGSFTLKSGKVSPIYLDLRLIISYPALLKKIGDLLWEKVSSYSFDLICGIPYTALPIATAISLSQNIPMILKRKEAKEYGTKKLIEGVYTRGQSCLIIEDVITTGSSIIETLLPLKSEHLEISHVALIVDREQGGRETLESHGLHVHPLITLTQIASTLKTFGKITPETERSILQFLKGAP